LRSEAYRAEDLETQLAGVVRECAERIACVQVDRDRNTLVVTPIMSWREPAFIATFAAAGEKTWGNRTPIERAAAAMAYPHVFATEQEFLAANTFRMEYGEIDWRLNDLTGGVPQ
jgi:hypothetical protein